MNTLWSQLAGALPRAEWRRIDVADRMDPISRPEAVDREIEDFLAQRQASWHRDPEPTAAFGRPVFRCRDLRRHPLDPSSNAHDAR